MRSHSELLQILLDNADKYYFKSYYQGLCFLADVLLDKDIITFPERNTISSYLMLETSNSDYCKEYKVMRLFPSHDLISRKQWLKKHIELTKLLS